MSMYDPLPNVHRHPYGWPLAWTRSYGVGHVFYTALGHEEGVWRDLGFRCFCVMLHYGCCENQLEPSNLASSAMKNRIGRATAREAKEPSQEISGCARMRGGAGRIRTSNQTIMSARL